MTNISRLYQQLNEGQVSKEYFVRRARIEHSNIVSPVNSYDDIIKILKNKGVLTEAQKLSTEQIIDRLNPYAVKKGIEVEMAKCKGDINMEKIRQKVAKNLSKNQKYYEEYQFPNAKAIDKYDSKQEMRQVKSELVDKNNAMRKPKGFSPDKANTKASKKENRRGNPKGVKMMKENDSASSGQLVSNPQPADYKVGGTVKVPTSKGTIDAEITRVENSTIYVLIGNEEYAFQANQLNQYTPKETPYAPGSEEMRGAWEKMSGRIFEEEEETPKTKMSEIVGKLKEFLAKRKKLKREFSTNQPSQNSQLYINKNTGRIVALDKNKDKGVMNTKDFKDNFTDVDKQP